MANVNNVASLSTAELLQQSNTQTNATGTTADFADSLKNALNDVNQTQQEGQKAMADLATGEVTDLHQAALSISKAETSMKLMLEIRNKALNAYKEIGRTQL